MLAGILKQGAQEATKQSGTEKINNENVEWEVRGDMDGIVWRYAFYARKNGNWDKIVDGLKSENGAKEHGFAKLRGEE